MAEDTGFSVGTAISHEWMVTSDVTVAAHGTVPLDVLATPHLIYMLEDTCVFAVASDLPEGNLTVGTEVNIRHLAAAYVGEKVVTHAELTSVDGRRLTFKVEARCGERLVADGTHGRFVVNAERFIARLRAEAGALSA